MAVNSEVRKKANRYFFSKVAVNTILVILGAVLIASFLRSMQNRTALVRQKENNETALADAISIIEANISDAEELTAVYHDNNQDMVEDLNELFRSGVFASLEGADAATRSEVFRDMIERSGVDYLFLMSDNGTALISPYDDFNNVNVVRSELISLEGLWRLTKQTRKEDGSVVPALEDNKYGYYYFYSDICEYGGESYYLVLGADASTLDTQISSLKDISVVLSSISVGNGGFLFAVDSETGTFLYYSNDGEILTGMNALEAGLSKEALQDGYSGIETINGVKYYCVSRTVGDKTVISAAADIETIYRNDKYVLFWSLSGFVLVMVMCLAYAVIVRNDFVRRAVKTDRKVLFTRKNGDEIIFDRSVFRKVFPLMITGVLLIFGISFYTQTLLEISESIQDSTAALDEVTARYEESTVNRQIIKEYYNDRFLSKAKLIAYLIEEDPSVLNEQTSRVHSIYDEDGNRIYLTDDEGNALRSVGSSARLQQICDSNDIESIYIFDEDGHTIATNTANWYFTISHDETAQSYEFLQVLDGRTDWFIQEAMLSDTGEDAQYVGVAFNYYTAKDGGGNTVYVSRYDYERALMGEQLSGIESAGGITPHRAMLQIGLDTELSEKIMASTDVDYVFSTDMLSGGFITLYDSSADHVCLYSPFEFQIGQKGTDTGVPEKAFTGQDYYGFTRMDAAEYFRYFRYDSGYYVGTAIPKSELFAARWPVSLITAFTSLILILILSLTVTMTTKEEEMLYETMSGAEGSTGLDSAIFNVLLPSGHSVSTVKAAARWDSRSIPWKDKNPEQKLMQMVSVVIGVLMVYVALSAIQAKVLFDENSVIKYILSGNWDRGPNIFAFSACMLVIALVVIATSLLRIPVRLITSLLGARGETIGHLLLSIVKYGGAILVLFYCLFLVGIDSTSLLASAGVLSLVIGLGAQSLIKDVIAGIFIVFEGEFRVGDIVTINGYRGTVMDIGLRTTKILGVDGNIKIYNNSDISGVLNMTKEASTALCYVNVEYGQDIDYIEEVLKRELPKLREGSLIMDGPTYLGVSKLGESGVELLVCCKCNEQDIYSVGRYLNRGILRIFQENGIETPFPKISVSRYDPEIWKDQK